MMKNRILTIALLMSAIGCAQAQKSLPMLVGTYTDGSSCGIYSFCFDQVSGKAEKLDSLALRNPSFLTLSRDGRYVYAVGETDDRQASLNTIRFDAKNGRMQLLSSAATEGKSPCYVATNGKMAVTANYSGGSMSVFRLNEGGSQATLTQRFLGEKGGPDLSRQEAPHVHCATFTPDGKYILATDFSADRICSYRLRGTTVVANGIAAQIAPSSGPRHLVFSRDGRFAYLISELSGKVSVFSYRDGRLKEIQTVVSDSVGARGSGDIHLSPDGKFLYSSNRLKADGIAIFAVDARTGKLTKVGYQLTGRHPRHFNITPNGRFLLCASRDDNKIQVFRRDEKTGLLTDIHQDIPVSKAVCVQFF